MDSSSKSPLLDDFESVNGLQVLDGHRLHVLSSAAEDVPELVLERLERVVSPSCRVRRNDVHVRVEQDGRKFRFESRPGHDDDRVSGDGLEDGNGEPELLGILGQELDAGFVIGLGMIRPDLKVPPEFLQSSIISCHV